MTQLDVSIYIEDTLDHEHCATVSTKKHSPWHPWQRDAGKLACPITRVSSSCPGYFSIFLGEGSATKGAFWWCTPLRALFKQILHINLKGTQLLLLNSTSIQWFQWLDPFPRASTSFITGWSLGSTFTSGAYKIHRRPKAWWHGEDGEMLGIEKPIQVELLSQRQILGRHNSWTSFPKLGDQNQPGRLRFSVLISSWPSKFNAC